MSLPPLDYTLGAASAKTTARSLTVDTGAFTRVWAWTNHGFATQSIAHRASNCQWSSDARHCDWQMPDAVECDEAQLLSLTAETSDDEGFTSKHLCVTAHIAYPGAGLEIKQIIWAFPGAPGLRTQLAVRRVSGEATPPNHRLAPSRIEHLPAFNPKAQRRFFGYYNDTQRRNETHTDILKEEVIAHKLCVAEYCDWASVCCLEDDQHGFALVQESHKCVNQLGHASGGFTVDPQRGVSLTGWGLHPWEITGEFRTAWASWAIAWDGGDLARESALKQFDQARYPIDPVRDIYIQANTWGSTLSGGDARLAATEPSVLQEIDVCAELGIDVLQIDDGWQVPPGHTSWKVADPSVWQPHPESYPEGWKNVRDRAAEKQVKLGLWAAAVPVGLDDLKENQAQGDFIQYKLDFASLNSKDLIDELMHKVREFIRWTGHRARVNWDVTENPPRYGYYFAREYGCIYLENRKPEAPHTTVYRPHTVLRDLWQVAKYLPLHRFQCSIQNVDMINRERSDAHRHAHQYAVAIALMGIPLFFLETKYYSPEAKAEIKPLLHTYKQHRDLIYRGMVHPIGDKPNNASWTGLQCHVADERCGYLTIFRELCNAESTQSLALGWLAGMPIKLTDLLTGKSSELTTGDCGAVEFAIQEAPGFLFLRYDY